jgi:SPP1 family predicted phage head-tail adaptor
MYLEAGKLRHVVTIYDPAPVQDSQGGTSFGNLAPFAVTRARIESLLGRELYEAQQLVAQVTHKITIRWQRGIRAKQFVGFRSPDLDRVFQIQHVRNPDDIPHLLILLCVERDDSARAFCP